MLYKALCSEVLITFSIQFTILPTNSHSLVEVGSLLQLCYRDAATDIFLTYLSLYLGLV